MREREREIERPSFCVYVCVCVALFTCANILLVCIEFWLHPAIHT